MVLEKTVENHLDCKEIKPANPKGNQSWVFIGRTDAEAETSILFPLDGKNWLAGKDPDAGKDWKQEEKGIADDEMVGSHHWLDGHEFEQTLEDGKEQGSLSCCSLWGHKESDRHDWVNNKSSIRGFTGGAGGKEPTCQCRRHKRHGFNPWVRKIPWKRHGNPL